MYVEYVAKYPEIDFDEILDSIHKTSEDDHLDVQM